MTNKPYSFDDIFLAVSEEDNSQASTSKVETMEETPAVSVASTQSDPRAENVQVIPTASTKQQEVITPEPTSTAKVEKKLSARELLEQEARKDSENIQSKVVQQNVKTNFSLNVTETNKREMASDLDYLMRHGRQENNKSYKRNDSKLKKLGDYFVINHDTTYYDVNSDYDGFYEDILPIDYAQVESARRAKKTLVRVIAFISIAVLIFFVAATLFIRYLIS